MAEDQVKDLFGSESEDDAPQADQRQADRDGSPEQQVGAPAPATDLFGSSDEDDKPAEPVNRLTQALGEDEDEDYPARCLLLRLVS
jgi:hypothetical protein